MKQSEIERLLPVVFQRTAAPGSPLRGLLAVMEALHAQPEEVLAQIDIYFDPYRTPDSFVPYLARWVDLEWLVLGTSMGAEAVVSPPPFPSGLARLRELIAAAAYHSSWRGTAYGLLSFLQMATGIAGFAIDEELAGPDGRPRPFHIRVRAPKESARYRDLIDRIIRSEKPAYVTYELLFGE